MRKSRRSWTVAGAVAVLMIGTAVTGCGSSGSAASSTSAREAATTLPKSTDPGPPTTIDQEAKDKAEITAVVDGWTALLADYYSGRSEWSDDEAAEFASGEVLEDTRSFVREWQAAGKVLRKAPNSVASVSIDFIEIGSHKAKIEMCEVNDDIVESSSGVVLDDRVGTYDSKWQLAKVEGRWTLAKLQDRELLEGAHKCF